MRLLLLLLITATLLAGCNRAKKAIHKTGETVGEGTTEFFNGVKQGVDKTLQCTVTIADALKTEGLSTGKFNVTSDTAYAENKLSIYLVFDKDFSKTLHARVYDPKGLEYGRATTEVSAKKGDARYVDFIFDKRTDIESKSRFVIE